MSGCCILVTGDVAKLLDCACSVARLADSQHCGLKARIGIISDTQLRGLAVP